jgi:drug/metabolite transporter (DMT)-like permease
MFSNTPILSIVNIVGASIIGAVGQFLFQYGAKQGKAGVVGFITNPYVLAGMVGYGAVMILFGYAFKMGGTVRILYPLYAMTFVWAAIIAFIGYGQPIQPIHITGMFLLITGIVCMSW